MSDAQDSRVGSMFGPYHLKRLLGRGGMGEVYEAEHTVKEWTVAVKLMTAEFSKDPVFRERMKREARIAGRLQEPHVVPIHDYGEVDGQMFLEMRLVEGTDLDSVLKRFGPLTPPRAVAIITQIASALDAAHADGVMHRDVKPQNILITRDDFAYLVDFGIASATTDEKLTQLGTAVGTWKYMAPERFSNDEVTYRADIYALACVLHECLTGAPPYRADSAGTLVSSHLMGPIPSPAPSARASPKPLTRWSPAAWPKSPKTATPAPATWPWPPTKRSATPTKTTPPTSCAAAKNPPCPRRLARPASDHAGHRHGSSAATRTPVTPPGVQPAPKPSYTPRPSRGLPDSGLAPPASRPGRPIAARCRPADPLPPRSTTRAAAGAHRRPAAPALGPDPAQNQPVALSGRRRRRRARPRVGRHRHLDRHPAQAGTAASAGCGGAP